MENVLLFSDLSQGQHNYTVIAQDEDGLTKKSENYFEGQTYTDIAMHIQ